MPSLHNNQESFSVTKNLKNFVITDTSVYGTGNHAKDYFAKYLIEVQTPDGNTLYFANYDFSIGSYTNISAPSDFVGSTLANTISQYGLGYYNISVYSIPVTGAGGDTYDTDDCFFRVDDSKIYKVVEGVVDITVDTDFTDTSKYTVIDILSVTSRYTSTDKIFILDYATRNCVTNKLQPAKCLIEDYPCDGNYCSNSIFVDACDLVMAIDLMEYLNNSDADIDVNETVAFLNVSCSVDDCCDDGVTTLPMVGSDCGCECEDEEVVPEEPSIDRMMGLRKKTDASDIATGNPKTRVFTALIDVAEEDIISVSVGDIEWSFESEILDWDSTSGTMTFLGNLPANIDDKPVWIRIQYILRAS